METKREGNQNYIKTNCLKDVFDHNLNGEFIKRRRLIFARPLIWYNNKSKRNYFVVAAGCVLISGAVRLSVFWSFYVVEQIMKHMSTFYFLQDIKQCFTSVSLGKISLIIKLSGHSSSQFFIRTISLMAPWKAKTWWGFGAVDARVLAWEFCAYVVYNGHS